MDTAKVNTASGQGFSGNRPPEGKREELLEMAIELISEEGLNACTFRALAERAGSSTRVFTYEFGTRQALLEAVLDHLWETAWPGWKEIGDPARLSDPLLVYYEICLNEIEDRHFHSSNAYLELFKASAHDVAIGEWLSRLDEEMLELHSALIEAAQEKGQVSDDLDPADVVSIFWALEDGIKIARLTYRDYFTPERMRRLFDVTFDRLLGLPEAARTKTPNPDP